MSPAAAEPRPAALPLPGGRPGAAVRLRPLVAGHLHLPRALLYADEAPQRRLRLPRPFGGGGEPERARVPVPAYLIEHPGAGLLLVDTGLHGSVAVDPGQSLGELARRWGPVELEPEQAVAARLRALGAGPDAVRAVVLTHLHADHVSAIADFPGATILVDRREWAAATTGRAAGYAARGFDHAFDWRLLDLEAAEVSSYATFARSLDLLGDGSVRVVSTPGHTPGHLSVVLRLEGGRAALLTGDACYTRETLERRRLPGALDDEHVFWRSLREIDLFVKQDPSALLIPGHDAEALAAARRDLGIEDG